jgi:hypothetical protein
MEELPLLLQLHPALLTLLFTLAYYAWRDFKTRELTLLEILIGVIASVVIHAFTVLMFVYHTEPYTVVLRLEPMVFQFMLADLLNPLMLICLALIAVGYFIRAYMFLDMLLLYLVAYVTLGLYITDVDVFGLVIQRIPFSLFVLLLTLILNGLAGIVFNLIHNYRVKAYKVGDATLPKLLFYYYTGTPIKYAYDADKDNLTNTIGWVKYGQPFLVYLAVAYVIGWLLL